MKNLKKIVAICLALTMILGVMTAFAGEAQEKQTIKIGLATCFTGDGARGANTQL